jgi:3-hydroxyacyl-CoA dehydrogenase
MRLMEIIRANQTSAQTLASSFALAKRLGKIAVEAGVCDGFIGNRILTRYRQTADILLIEGALPHEIDTAMESFGMAMGPYAAQDLSGLDIAYANRQRNNWRQNPSIRYIPIADHLVEHYKRLGRKTSAGWYDYANGSRQVSSLVETIIEEASKEAGIQRRSFTKDQISERITLAIICEGLDILQEKIARRPADIDLVEIHGYGFPRWRGGPMQYADEWGLDKIQKHISELAKNDPKSWRSSQLLDDLCARNKSIASLNS